MVAVVAAAVVGGGADVVAIVAVMPVAAYSYTRFFE